MKVIPLNSTTYAYCSECGGRRFFMIMDDDNITGSECVDCENTADFEIDSTDDIEFDIDDP